MLQIFSYAIEPGHPFIDFNLLSAVIMHLDRNSISKLIIPFRLFSLS